MVLAACGAAASLTATGALGQGARAIDAEQVLPIRGITLYRSGVGGVLRAGGVSGDVTVDLDVATGDINDMLKSMTILDYGGGSVSAITYDPADPLDRTLASFDIDLSGNPSIAELFDQLRGQRVTVTLTTGEVESTVLGTEVREVEVEGVESGVQRQRFVNLVTDAGIRSVRVNDVRAFRVMDEDLASELGRALATIAQRRTEDAKSVAITLSGSADRERDVAVFTIQEMPVWKMSYRLVLPESPADEPILQGYAIVENTTDADWENVTLSLAAGRPVSFEMNLYEPLYLDRPDVAPPLLAAARPKVFQAGRGGAIASAPPEALAVAGSAVGEAELADRGRFARVDRLGGGLAIESGTMGGSAASGETVGGQFFLTLDEPVSIARRTSAMLPVVSGDIEGERLAIYNPADNDEHPMRGVMITNTTELTLLPGPITVFDASAYAGDAQIPHVPAESEQLLAYAVDLDVLAEVADRTRTTIDRIRIVNGALDQRSNAVKTTTYSFTNRDATDDRAIMIEHRPERGYDLTTPSEPDERTSDFLRFRLTVDAGDTREFEVVEDRVVSQRLSLDAFPIERLLRFRAEGKLSQAVIDAVREAARLRELVADTRRRIEALDSERTAIEDDQRRIRENIARVGRDSDLFLRYARKLDEQETRLEEMAAQRQELTRTLEEREEALNAYLRDLDVG